MLQLGFVWGLLIPGGGKGELLSAASVVMATERATPEASAAIDGPQAPLGPRAMSRQAECQSVLFQQLQSTVIESV